MAEHSDSLRAARNAALRNVHDTEPTGNAFDKATDRMTRLELLALRNDAAKLYARLNWAIAEREQLIVRKGAEE